MCLPFTSRPLAAENLPCRIRGPLVASRAPRHATPPHPPQHFSRKQLRALTAASCASTRVHVQSSKLQKGDKKRGELDRANARCKQWEERRKKTISALSLARKPKDARRRQDGVIFVEARRWAVRAATFCYVCLVIRHHLPKPHPARLCARRLGALPRLLRDGSHVQASSTGGAPCKRMSRTISARPSRTASWSLTVSCLLDANACRPQRGRCRRRTTGCKNRLGSTGRRPTDCVVAVQARWVR